MEIEMGLEIAADPIEPIAQAVFLSSLHRPSWIERPAIQQGREFDVRLRLVVTSEPHPEIEVDAERILLHVDPVDANDVDARIDDTLNPVMPVPERHDMAFLAFRSDMDAMGLIDADELQRGRAEPAVAEETQPDRARNVAVRVEIEPPSQPSDRRFWTVDRTECDGDSVAICNLAVGPVLDVSPFQRLDHQARGVICAAGNPAWRGSHFRLVVGGKGLRRHAGAVENQRRCGIQILAEETRMRFFLGLVDEILQIAFAGCALGCDDRPLDAAAAQRLDDISDKIGCAAITVKPGPRPCPAGTSPPSHHPNPPEAAPRPDHRPRPNRKAPPKPPPKLPP